MLAKGDEQVVDIDPIPFWQYIFKRIFGLFGVRRRNQAKTVGDSVDMGVDADGRDAKTEAENQVGGLATHSGKVEQRTPIGWHLPRMVGQNAFGNTVNLLSFDPIESSWKNQLSNTL